MPHNQGSQCRFGTANLDSENRGLHRHAAAGNHTGAPQLFPTWPTIHHVAPEPPGNRPGVQPGNRTHAAGEAAPRDGASSRGLNRAPPAAARKPAFRARILTGEAILRVPEIEPPGQHGRGIHRAAASCSRPSQGSQRSGGRSLGSREPDPALVAGSVDRSSVSTRRRRRPLRRLRGRRWEPSVAWGVAFARQGKRPGRTCQRPAVQSI
jgi:hypothetical protein